jgi:lipopolysaccharide transport system permease protein
MATEIERPAAAPPPSEAAAPASRRPPADDLPEVVIDALPHWGINLRELWSRRELLYFLVLRDIKVRYRETVLGGVWALAQPTIMMVIFTVFIAPGVGAPAGGASDIPYPLYVYSGFLAWNFFASAINGAAVSVIHSEELVTKVYFPRLLLPLATVGVSLVDLAIASCGLVVLMVYYGIYPGWSVLLLPIWVVLCALAGFAVGTLLAALNVRYRDFRFLMPYLIQVWMFSTPAIFLRGEDVRKAEIFGSQETYEWLRKVLLEVNPVNSLIISFRAVALGGPAPWRPLGVAALVVAGLLLVGCYYFRRVEDNFADVI